MPANPSLSWLFLSLPPLLAFMSLPYLLYPFAPTPLTAADPSLASLPPTNPARTIYPENLYGEGSYASLPWGETRYWIVGPEKGKKLVLIHGLSVPSVIWAPMVPYLTKAGFRVLLYDLPGRGYTEAPQPPTEYIASLYTAHLALLLQHVGWVSTNPSSHLGTGKGVSIAGLSMGGGIAAAFTAHFPHMAGDLFLVSSAGLVETSDTSRTSRLMSSNLAQSLSNTWAVKLYLRHLASKAVHALSSEDIPKSDYSHINPSSLATIVTQQSAHLLGYNRAIASSLRVGPIRGLEPAFNGLLTHGGGVRRVKLVHGTNDTTVPYSHAKRALGVINKSEENSTVNLNLKVEEATLLTVPGGPHFMTVSHPELLASSVIEFFGLGK